jgi:PAS domain S-box-containing protein
MKAAVLVMVLSLAGTVAAVSPPDPTPTGRNAPRVLVIHSYYPTFTWSNRITQGIQRGFSESELSHADLHFEYMDAKRHPGSTYLNQYAEYLKAKYPHPEQIDLIICSDDQALNFLLARSTALFPGVPLVFCAVNGYDPGMHGHGRAVTGVIEAIAPAKTLDVALELQRDIRQVLVITDVTVTGRAIKRMAREVFRPYEERLAFRYVSDLSMAELQREVSALPQRTIAFLFVFNRDNTGEDFTHEESLHMIAERCRVPIYGPWTFYLDHGIVGGMLTSGEMQGRSAASLALRILRGERAADIPVVTESPNRYMFDYRQMSQHNLPLDRLPPSSRVINRPPDFYGKYRYQIWAIAAALLIQTVVILLLLMNMRRRRRADQELTNSEQRYRTLVETIRDLVFIVDPNGRLNFLNPEFEKMTGYSSKDFIGRPFTDVLTPDHVQPTVDRFQRGLAGEEIPVYEVEVKSRDGGPIPLELKVTSLMDAAGRVAGRIGVARDIRERKEVEEERMRLESQLQRAQKMEAIGTLAGGVAHDLNNILSGIVSYPDLLLMQLEEDSPLRKPIQTIKSSGQKAAAIVQDLLTMARRGVAASDIVNLNHMVKDYLNSPEYETLQFYHPNVDVEFSLEGDLLPIEASPVHLAKSLMNLISNAAEAMPEGGTIRVSTENRYVDTPVSGYDHVTEGDYAVLSVSDSGVGISSKDRERIFEPFYTKKVMGRSGTGLGMAVVWGTVKDLKGYIDVQTEEGEGTTFRLYFPVTRKKAVPETASVSSDAYRGNGESILVVDDVETQREIASVILSHLGYRVRTLSSGEEAIQHLSNHPVDLVVLDMIMAPGMDGLETYKKILTVRPEQKAVVVSGFSQTERVKEAHRLGAGAYLRKPYTTEKLGMVVRQELDR